MENNPTRFSIQGVDVYTVQDSKYLGVHLDNKLDWTKNIVFINNRFYKEVLPVSPKTGQEETAFGPLILK